MSVNRRNFLVAGFAAAIGATTAGAKAIAHTLAPKAAAETAAKVGATAALGSYGAGVRAQVFEVIVRQGLAGAPWKEICAGPMQVNSITEAEVQNEINRRLPLIQQAKEEHPTHPDGKFQTFCPTCLEENSEYYKEYQQAVERHPTEHPDFVLGCRECWVDFRRGVKAHPKFGMRGSSANPS